MRVSSMVQHTFAFSRSSISIDSARWVKSNFFFSDDDSVDVPSEYSGEQNVFRRAFMFYNKALIEHECD